MKNVIPISNRVNIEVAACLGLENQAPSCFRVAGRDCRSDVSLPSLQAFEAQVAGADVHSAATSFRPNGKTSEARGWLGGDTRTVLCHHGEGGYLLEIAGIGKFLVTRPEGHIRCLELESEVSLSLLEEVMLGPPMVLSLVIQDTWCLHASGVVRDGKALLFLGASGNGKSTLAAWLGRGEEGFKRITDDVTPCSTVGGIASVLPHFPQLKLDTAAQYPLSASEQLPVRAIVVLNPDASMEQPQLDGLKHTEALSVMLNQTMVVTLFDRDLHQAHLLFLAKLVEQSPVYRLSFPHDYNSLPEVGLLLSDMANN